MAAKNRAISIVVVTIAAINGLFLFGNGLFMLLAPSTWYNGVGGQSPSPTSPDLMNTTNRDSAMLSSQIVEHAHLKVYKSAPHGTCTTHKDQINADLLAFIKS